ncbi:MAG: Gldg family protein [Clostridia bacterium]|nr:Gldg family protein [Clostridia bacterium]
MTAIYRKDARAYLHSVFGWGMMALLLCGFGLFIAIFNLMTGTPNLAYAISYMQAVLVVVIPVMTLRALVEERWKGTDRLLLSLPIRTVGIVLGKYFAVFTLFAIPTALCGLYPLLLACFGKVSFGSAYAALLGYLLLGAALIALCLFLSSLCARRLTAALWGIGVCLAVYLLGMLEDLLGGVPLLSDLLHSVNPFARSAGLLYGRLDLSAILYLLCFTALFLFLTVLSLKRRRRGGNGAFRRKWLTLPLVAGALAVTVGLQLLVGVLPYAVTHVDVTGSRVFLVSEQTRGELAKLDQPVTIYFLCEGGQDRADADLYSYLLEYTNASPNLTLQVVDTRRSEQFFKDHPQAAGLSDQSLVVQSQRRYKLMDNTELYYYYNTQMGLTMSSSEYMGYLSAYQSGNTQNENYAYGMYLTQYAAYTEAYFNGNSVLTNALQFVTLEQIPTVYLLTGDGMALPDTQFLATMDLNAYGLRGLSDLTSIPGDCDALMIYAPTEDLTQGEADGLRSYLQGGGKLYLVTAYTCTDLPLLAAVLADYGLFFEEGDHVVCEGDSEYFVTVSDTPYQYFIWAHVVAHPATGNDFGGEYLLRYAHGIRMEPVDGVTQTSWIRTSEKGYLWYNTDDNAEAEELAQSTKGEHHMGVIAEKGDSTVVWISSPDATTNYGNVQSAGGNFDVAVSCFGYLCGTDHVAIALEAAQMDTSVLTVTVGNFVWLAVLLVLLIPVALLITGITRAYIRKRRSPV